MAHRLRVARFSIRKRVGRRFGNLTCRCGGLGSTTLPAWVRTSRRVRLWVMAKLLLNAARIRQTEREAAERTHPAASSTGVAA